MKVFYSHFIVVQTRKFPFETFQRRVSLDFHWACPMNRRPKSLSNRFDRINLFQFETNNFRVQTRKPICFLSERNLFNWKVSTPLSRKLQKCTFQTLHSQNYTRNHRTGRWFAQQIFGAENFSPICFPERTKSFQLKSFDAALNSARTALAYTPISLWSEFETFISSLMPAPNVALPQNSCTWRCFVYIKISVRKNSGVPCDKSSKSFTCKTLSHQSFDGKFLIRRYPNSGRAQSDSSSKQTLR